MSTGTDFPLYEETVKFSPEVNMTGKDYPVKHPHRTIYVFLKKCAQIHAAKHVGINTHRRVHMHSHFALQPKFIKDLVTGLWKPSLSLSGAVGHNYKDSCSIKTETLDAFEVRF